MLNTVDPKPPPVYTLAVNDYIEELVEFTRPFLKGLACQTN